MSGYLENLTLRMGAGLAAQPEAFRQKHTQFMLARQQPDGGFTGREGESDLYYSGFGLRSLAVLGELKDDIAKKAGSFLRGRLTGRESIVDFLSLMYSARLLAFLNEIDIFDQVTTDWRSAVVDKLNALRRDDGGFAKGAEGNASSTYHTFLVMICLELLGAEVPQPEKIVEFLKTQNMDEGGFREIRVSKRAGTNP
ncbi:MAG: prenyltransferase/squalene oxidase repeat-containing protein, partial [Planctomycetota bacterium]